MFDFIWESLFVYRYMKNICDFSVVHMKINAKIKVLLFLYKRDWEWKMRECMLRAAPIYDDDDVVLVLAFARWHRCVWAGPEPVWWWSKCENIPESPTEKCQGRLHNVNNSFPSLIFWALTSQSPPPVTAVIQSILLALWERHSHSSTDLNSLFWRRRALAPFGWWKVERTVQKVTLLICDTCFLMCSLAKSLALSMSDIKQLLPLLLSFFRVVSAHLWKTKRFCMVIEKSIVKMNRFISMPILELWPGRIEMHHVLP